MDPRLRFVSDFSLLLFEAAFEMQRQLNKAFRIGHRKIGERRGRRMRPGHETPLWNELRAQLRPYLRNYGEQAKLGRIIGLPRQRINDFVTGGGRMPDAERTLQLLALLMAIRVGRKPE